LEEAWAKVLDVNRDGKLSYTEFKKGFTQLRSNLQGRNYPWASDLQGLFSQLDLGQAGTVTLADLQRIRGGAANRPEAAWWKFLVHRNWGSLKRLQVAGLLKICEQVEVRTKTTKSHLKNVFGEQFAGQRQETTELHQNLSTAFTLESLGVDTKTIMLRNLAKKHNLSILDLEELNKRFREVDSDSSGYLEEPEFTKLVLTVHGATDKSDIPKGRLHFYWTQADSDNSGEVDFEEFVVFFKKYAGDVDLRRMKLKPINKDIASPEAEDAPEGTSKRSKGDKASRMSRKRTSVLGGFEAMSMG